MVDMLTLRRGLLAVNFEKRLDRYAHRIALVCDSETTPLAESVEGWPEDDWPPSPALQQLQMEDRPRQSPHPHPLPKGEGEDHAVALLVGMAGHSHWSLGVEPASESESSCLQF